MAVVVVPLCCVPVVILFAFVLSFAFGSCVVLCCVVLCSPVVGGVVFSEVRHSGGCVGGSLLLLPTLCLRWVFLWVLFLLPFVVATFVVVPLFVLFAVCRVVSCRGTYRFFEVVR